MAKARKTKAKRKRAPARRSGTRHGTTGKKRAFLAAFGKLGNMTAAAEGLVDRSTVYDWIESDPKFAEAFRLAKEEAGDRLEEEARRRAHDGWLEPVFSKGVRAWDGVDEDGNVVHPESERAVRVVPALMRKYSDRLLEILLKGAKPEKYRERFEHTGRDGGPIENVVVFLPDNARGDRAE